MADGTPDGRLLEALGLARRAGHLAVGTRSVLQAVDEGELRVAVVAADAGDNALGRLTRVLEGPAPVVRATDRRALGEALGRGPVVVVGVTEAGLAGKVRRLADPGRRAGGRTPAEDAETNPIHAS